MRDGAANSHAAILTRAMDIPTVMGADILPAQLNKRLLIVDGYRGELLIDPEPALVQDYQRLISEENPCLGWRSIRLTLDQPEIFLV